MSDAATLAVIDALDGLGIPYMIVGLLSSNRYGIPRSSQDADFIVELGDRSITEVARRLGPGFRLDPPMSFETVTATTRAEFLVVDTGFKVELFGLSDDPHDRERFRRRVRVPVLGREAWAPTAEDVILTKLRWARPKDRDDVRDVIAAQGDRLDWDYIHAWADPHGTSGLLDAIRRSIAPP